MILYEMCYKIKEIKEILNVKQVLYLMGINEENICKSARKIVQCECISNGKEKNLY